MLWGMDKSKVLLDQEEIVCTLGKLAPRVYLEQIIFNFLSSVQHDYIQ